MKSSPIPLKAWVDDEAARAGVCRRAIFQRIASGQYPDLKLERVNKRVVWVHLQPGQVIEWEPKLYDGRTVRALKTELAGLQAELAVIKVELSQLSAHVVFP